LFFGALIPLVLKSTESLILPPIFALGTGLPVILFSFIIAFAVQKLSQVFQAMQKIEKVMHYGIATIFLLAGIYYLQFLVKYLMNL
jgi:threonine/homoserine/homoserine lactone efflux protein